jgi:hypothetical protein
MGLNVRDREGNWVDADPGLPTCCPSLTVTHHRPSFPSPLYPLPPPPHIYIYICVYMYISVYTYR